MRSFRNRRMVLVLLLAALGQPAWAVSHAAVHEHLARHHAAHHHEAHHHETHQHAEASPHSPSSAFDAHASERTSVEPAERSHHHDHEHPSSVVVSLPRSPDHPAPIALPPAPLAISRTVALSWTGHRESQPSRASPATSGPSGPRAPPIA